MVVINVPAMNLTYAALKGKGAVRVENKHIEKLAIQKNVLRKPPIFAVSRSHLNKTTQDFIKINKAITVAAGSSLKLIMLSEGKVDIYPRFGPTSLWDVAAGHIILRETGGDIITLDGQSLDYNFKKLLNPDIIGLRHKMTKYTWK